MMIGCGSIGCAKRRQQPQHKPADERDRKENACKPNDQVSNRGEGCDEGKRADQCSELLAHRVFNRGRSQAQA